MAATENASATADSIFNQVNHPLHMLRANHRADIGIGIVAGTNTQLFRFCHAAGGKLIADGLLDEEALDGKTDLAAIRVAAPDGGAGGDIEVGVSQDEHGIFAAEFQHSGN